MKKLAVYSVLASLLLVVSVLAFAAAPVLGQEPLPGGEVYQGCAAIFWAESGDAWSSTEFTPDQTVGSVFSQSALYRKLGTLTLRRALMTAEGFGTSGAAKSLIRAAIASMLNASHPDVEYPRTPEEVVDAVNTALGSSNSEYDSEAKGEGHNESG